MAHWPFAVALTLGALVRVVVQLGYQPAFIFSDGPAYLALIDSFEPSADRPVGYGVLLRALSWATPDLGAVAATQHVLGLATGVVLYVLLRRWGVPRWPATLATLPVLLDAMQLALEHSVLSDVLFMWLLVLGLAILTWRPRPSATTAALAGLVLGVAVLVRLVGEPVVLPAVIFCVMVGASRRRKVVTSLALVAAFGLPLVAYATWYHQERGVFSLAEFSGRSLYMRTTSFVDCSTVDIPAYERVLCPVEPVSQRRDPTYYLWHDDRTVPSLDLPVGVSVNQAARDFALRAIRNQPLDFLRVGARDFLLNFSPGRIDHYGYTTAYKWMFGSYVDYEPTVWTGPAYATYGGDQLVDHQPLSGAVAAYSRTVYLWGPLLLACLGLAVAGTLRRGPPTTSRLRAVALLLTLVGTGLMLMPDLTAEFVWRYQLPAVVLLPAAAALSWTRLKAAHADGT